MLVCEKCNWESPDYAAFCTNCGTPVGSAKKAEAERWRFNDQSAQPPVVGAEAESDDPNDGEETSEEAGPSSDSAGDAHPGESTAAVDSKPVGVAVRSARTLVDLTVPDFRAMVDMAKESAQASPAESQDGVAVEAVHENVAEPHDSQPVTGATGADEVDNETTGSVADDEKSLAAGAELSLADHDEKADSADAIDLDITAAPSDEGTSGSDEGTSGSDESVSPALRSIDPTVDAEHGREASSDDEPLQEPDAAPAAPKDLGSLDVVIEEIDGDESIDGLLLSSADVSPIELPGFVAGAQRASAPAPKAPNASNAPGDQIERFVLRCLSSTGSGGVIPLSEGGLTIGRTDCDASLPNDEYVSSEHARVVLKADAAVVTDLDSVNGVWLRIRGEHKLTLGSQFLVGEQVFVVGAANDGDTGQSPMPNGTRRIGQAWRSSEMTVSRLSSNGRVVARFAVPKDGLRIGRTQGEIIICDDTFLSGIHAQISCESGESLQLRDLSTGNGCWVRMNGPLSLREGDSFMTGRTCWRVGRALVR
jgi:pSer/pThr/pTyr-binding forkhead associated (FHA) protein